MTVDAFVALLQDAAAVFPDVLSSYLILPASATGGVREELVPVLEALVKAALSCPS
ncbi:MAG: hypothetical protein H6741_22080 [Alphaproteobacteria bacterium]|nr:hypothetical protein [Alphaproteobacteria bacterium]